MGILNSIYVHMHKQCLHMGIVFGHACMFVCICRYCNYLMFYISYNATITANAVAHFFPYKAQAALHHVAEDEVADEVESRSLIASYYTPNVPSVAT